MKNGPFFQKRWKKTARATEIITNTDMSVDQRYKKYFNELESAARSTIGKTTFKDNRKTKLTDSQRDLQQQKKDLKYEIQNEHDLHLKL